MEGLPGIGARQPSRSSNANNWARRLADDRIGRAAQPAQGFLNHPSADNDEIRLLGAGIIVNHLGGLAHAQQDIQIRSGFALKPLDSLAGAWNSCSR